MTIAYYNRIFENSDAVPDHSKFIAVRSYRGTAYARSPLSRLTYAPIKYRVETSTFRYSDIPFPRPCLYQVRV